MSGLFALCDSELHHINQGFLFALGRKESIWHFLVRCSYVIRFIHSSKTG